MWECVWGIYSHLAGRLSGMALRVDAQYPAGLLVDVRKQVVDRFARFVAQDVDAQVADRRVFDPVVRGGCNCVASPCNSD